MIEKSVKGMTATRLRLILFASIAVMIIAISIGFYFLQSYLYSFSVNVSHANEDASTSATDIATFGRLEDRLETDAGTIKRVESIVADSKSYEYQDQIITDLNTYAARTGVSISSFSFNAGGAAAAGTTTAPTANPTIAPIPGLKATAVSITLASPTKYKNLMNFIHSIEQNLTKMQLASLSLTKGAANDEVTINTLEIEVYIK